MPFCIHCGREVSEDVLVCPYCGKKLRAEPAPAEKQTTRQVSAAEVVGLVLGILGAAVVIAAGMNAASTDIGTAFVGLGMFLLAIVLLLFARTSKS
jgi:DNA-directed RNA polymerase subunit RPC12/RpoP